ncbi:MAG: ATP-binding protein [Thiobacillus sp.]|nr:ATP-binding protein [Thiobacillus sp.]MDP2978539.1 ATP-binding protein [Thiobacillus sp.]
MSILNLEGIDPSLQRSAEDIVHAYSQQLGGVQPDWYLKDRPDGPYLIIEFASPSEHHYKIHNSLVSELPEENHFKERSAVQTRRASPKARLLLPETQLLKKVIAESLTIDRNSFNDDFFSHYTASVTALEQQISTNANFVVYGRRGAGKSSLLAYAMHTAIKNRAPYSWVAMQTFARRSDHQVIPAVISAILYDLNQTSPGSSELEDLIKAFDALSESSDKAVLVKCDRIIPRTRRLVGQIATVKKPLTIFLDDLHVIDESVQPLVLAFIYKITRGNNTFIKISGIAQLTMLWDGTEQIGLQPPHDAQLLNLDLNLTMPDKSKEHIISILNAHARYCGLPSIGYLAGDDVLSRLVLVAAGVPRDSLSLFSVAISKAIAKSQKLVTITSINAAASEMVEEKLKDVERDTGDDLKAIQSLLAEVKKFCISLNRKNAFLVEIKNADSRYKLIQKLIALRLVHLLHEGITPHKAGKRFIALMLDYGFYVGIRAARSVDFIPSEPRQLSAKELRSLPIFR